MQAQDPGDHAAGDAEGEHVIRDKDPIDQAERVVIDRAELRRRIENLYEKMGDPLPEKWVLQIELGSNAVEVKAE